MAKGVSHDTATAPLSPARSGLLESVKPGKPSSSGASTRRTTAARRGGSPSLVESLPASLDTRGRRTTARAPLVHISSCPSGTDPGRPTPKRPAALTTSSPRASGTEERERGIGFAHELKTTPRHPPDSSRRVEISPSASPRSAGFLRSFLTRATVTQKWIQD